MLAHIKAFLTRNRTDEREGTIIFGTILVASVLGLIAAFVLSVEKLELIKNPDAVLSCSINVVLNCASVMKTDQASVFGFPNSYIGLMAFPVLITLAVGWFAGARYKRWFMVGTQIGATLGLLFAYWLFFQSVYVIQVLCPWCLLVTFVTTIIFEGILRYNVLQNNFNLPNKLHAKMVGWYKKDYDTFVFACWYVLLALLIFLKFGDGIFG